MRALSLGLVKGSLDGVDQIAHLHWVQPRVLDAAQVRMCWFAPCFGPVIQTMS